MKSKEIAEYVKIEREIESLSAQIDPLQRRIIALEARQTSLGEVILSDMMSNKVPFLAVPQGVFQVAPGRVTTEVQAQYLWGACEKDSHLKDQFWNCVKVLVTEARRYLPEDLLSKFSTKVSGSPRLTFKCAAQQDMEIAKKQITPVPASRSKRVVNM